MTTKKAKPAGANGGRRKLKIDNLEKTMDDNKAEALIANGGGLDSEPLYPCIGCGCSLRQTDDFYLYVPHRGRVISGKREALAICRNCLRTGRWRIWENRN